MEREITQEQRDLLHAAGESQDAYFEAIRAFEHAMGEDFDELPAELAGLSVEDVLDFVEGERDAE